MRRHEKQVFTLVSRVSGSRYPVLFWNDYGVVAPQLWTTNGSAGYTARLCAGHIAHGSYTVEDSTLDPGLDFTDAAALWKALLTAFMTWNETTRPPKQSAIKAPA